MKTAINSQHDLDAREKQILDLTLAIIADEGMDRETAAKHALAALPDPSPEFVDWLSEGTLVVTGGRTYLVRILEDLKPGESYPEYDDH